MTANTYHDILTVLGKMKKSNRRDAKQNYSTNH